MLNKKIIIFDSEALKNIYQRVFFSIVIFIIFYSLIFFQIFNIMIISNYSNNYSNVNTETIQTLQNKGSIYDRNGLLLASTIKTYSLFTNPNKIFNKEELSQKLEKILSIPQTIIFKKLSKKTNRIYIKRNITPKEHQEIINLSEIQLQTETS